ncbi:outer dynein arm-docking complex subunit 4-like [Cotesia glomerata]|uniref:outer dynein arm-docking complex subunit 4-like n=1 Tax=Cotesia glomerata TaxID=32391 RepID=UPI001D02AB5B|nr:outer dynein arm-docking complex subunit 4-like [Cotesia glomerata]
MDFDTTNEVTGMSYGMMTELEKLLKLEERIKQKSKGRQLAKALHEQADLLYSKGDYETALVLYHRAATADPRDTSHNAAAYTTSRAIRLVTSAAGDAKTKTTYLQKAVQKMIKSHSVLPSTLCPPDVATEILSKSQHPLDDVSTILKCLDSQVSFSGECVKDAAKARIRKSSASKLMLKRKLSQNVDSAFRFRFVDIKRSFAAGDWDKTIEIGRNLLLQKKIIKDCNCVVNIYRYVALAFVGKKRHDHAIVQVSKMIQTAKQSNDIKLVSRSLAVLGKVHLTFGHVYAAAKAWERLNSDITEPIVKAWLVHEIGRCYFEMSYFTKALELARRCVSCSEQAQSGKWLCYGKLLAGQTLVELGQLTRALESLKLVAEMAGKEINDDDLRETFNRRNSNVIENSVKSLSFSGESMKKNADLLRKVDDKLNQQSVNKNNGSRFVDKWRRTLTESKRTMIKSESCDFYSSNVVTENNSKTRPVFLALDDLEKENGTEYQRQEITEGKEELREQGQEGYSLATLSDKMSPGLTKLESLKLSYQMKVKDNKKFKLEECFQMDEDHSDKSISTNRTYDVTK